MLETSTDYGKPYRPLPVSILNRMGRLAGKFGLGPRLDADKLVAQARRRTGLAEFGDEWFLEPLRVLIKSINDEARLTPVGSALQRARILSVLSTRLRAEALLRKNPGILDIDLGKIILIAGLPRTATTSLHRLIAADPAVRKLTAWEALNPVPLRGETPDDPRRRLRTARLAQRMMGFLAPEFLAVHPIRYDAPEEDILLLDLSFMSQTPEAMMHVPSYAAWLERQDHTRSYAFLLTMLKLLHWQRPGTNWVLKTPNHMEHLDVILDVFPGALIVQTHRDPKKSFASFCSMVAHGRGILSDHVHAREIAGHWLRKTRRMMQRSMAVRRTADADAFIDVSYYDLIANPLDELRRIYAAAGIEFTAQTESAASVVARRNANRHPRRHVYSLSSFGLDDETVEAYFACYRREYRTPDEDTVFSARS